MADSVGSELKNVTSVLERSQNSQNTSTSGSPPQLISVATNNGPQVRKGVYANSGTQAPFRVLASVDFSLVFVMPCCGRKKHTKLHYPVVHINDRDANADGKFSVNMISTTKYTWWNFIFKNLFEQFRY